MAEETNDERVVTATSCRETTNEELDLLEWAEASVRDSVQALHNYLQQIVTLVTAALAGSVAFLKDAMTPGWRAALIAFLVIALGTAIFGVMPRTLTYRTRFISDAREMRDRLIHAKTRCLRAALAALLLAGVTAFLGVLAMPKS